MDCNECRELFSEYYDAYCDVKNAKASTSHSKIKAHLEQCGDCMAAYNEYAFLFNEVRNLPEPEMPENFHKTLMKYVQENKEDLPFYTSLVDDDTASPLSDIHSQLSIPEQGRGMSRVMPFITKQRKRAITRITPIITVAASLIFIVLWVGGVFYTPSQPTEYIPIVNFSASLEGALPAGRDGRAVIPNNLQYEPDEASPSEAVTNSRNNIFLATSVSVIVVGTFSSILLLIGSMRRS